MRRIVVNEIVQDSKEKLVEFDDLRGGTMRNPFPTDPPDLSFLTGGGDGFDGNITGIGYGPLGAGVDGTYGAGVDGTLGGGLEGGGVGVEAGGVGLAGGGVGIGKQNVPSNL
jgi:hypothetical protein